MARLVEALNKVYADKHITIKTTVDDLTFFGDERDLMELLGNLLDNACKYGRSIASLSVTREEQAIRCVIEDDGSGIADTRLNGSGDYQTRFVNTDDYRAQEFPNGTATTVATYFLRINKA